MDQINYCMICVFFFFSNFEFPGHTNTHLLRDVSHTKRIHNMYPDRYLLTLLELRTRIYIYIYVQACENCVLFLSARATWVVVAMLCGARHYKIRIFFQTIQKQIHNTNTIILLTLSLKIRLLRITFFY